MERRRVVMFFAANLRLLLTIQEAYLTTLTQPGTRGIVEAVKERASRRKIRRPSSIISMRW